MNKGQQIKQMMLNVPQKIVAYDGNPAGQHLYGEQRQQIAEALYNAGYRKVSASEAELQELNIKYYNEAKDLRRQLADIEAQNKRLAEKLGQILLSIDTFKEKLKKQIAIYCRYGYVDYDDIVDVIDELLKEYEK